VLTRLVCGAGIGTVLLAVAAATAQDEPLRLARLTGRVEFDGRPDEEAWREVSPLPMTLYAPVYRGVPAQRTDIRIAYDDEYLYVGATFADSEPAGIRVNSLYRDRWNGDDAFALYVDVFNDNRNAKWFGVTPAGMRFDLLVSDDGATTNESWDGFWDARAALTSGGWSLEMRIPFSTLGFQTVDGDTVMGLTATRLVARDGERVTFPDIDPQFEFRAPSRARDVVLSGVRTRRPVYLTPYVRGGSVRATPGAASELSREMGVDVRYALSSTLTMDLTANTDFAQVEADTQQIALDRFPLFFPEKRRFFQEGSGLFSFATAGGGLLFHSRRIGLTEDRRSVPVFGGARLVGRAGEWEVGLLDMQTQRLDTTPSENFGVLRLRRHVLNANSYVGGMVTARAGAGAHNFAAGIDSDLRVSGENYLTVKWAGTSDEADPRDASALSRSLFDARWQRRQNRGLAYMVQLFRVGRDHRPDLGFLPRSDVTGMISFANYYVYTDAHQWLRRIYPGFVANSTFRNADRVLESGVYAVWLQWDTKKGGGGWIEPKLFHEDVRVPFQIGGKVGIPAGRYTFADLQLVLKMSAGRKLRTDVDLRSGTFFDGTRTQLILGPTWNASRHLELNASYQLTRLRFPVRHQAADLHLVGVEIRAAKDARASANALVQYNSTTNRVDLNLRLRYNVAEGSDLWIVYDEGLATDRSTVPGAPLAPLSAARGLVVKYSHTFTR
jgi:hypothetical protein